MTLFCDTDAAAEFIATADTEYDITNPGVWSAVARWVNAENVTADALNAPV